MCVAIQTSRVQPDAMNQVERMYAEMEAQDISPAEMARLLDITSQRLGNWPSRGSIPKSMLEPVAKALRVSLLWLMTGNGPKHISDSMMTGLRSVAELADALGDKYSKDQIGELSILFAQLIRAHEDKQAARHAGATDKAHSLADQILTMSDAGSLADDKCDAIALLLGLRAVETRDSAIIHGATTAEPHGDTGALQQSMDEIPGALMREASDIIKQKEEATGLRYPSPDRDRLIRRVATVLQQMDADSAASAGS